MVSGRLSGYRDEELIQLSPLIELEALGDNDLDIKTFVLCMDNFGYELYSDMLSRRKIDLKKFGLALIEKAIQADRETIVALLANHGVIIEPDKMREFSKLNLSSKLRRLLSQIVARQAALQFRMNAEERLNKLYNVSGANLVMECMRLAATEQRVHDFNFAVKNYILDPVYFDHSYNGIKNHLNEKLVSILVKMYNEVVQGKLQSPAAFFNLTCSGRINEYLTQFSIYGKRASALLTAGLIVQELNDWRTRHPNKTDWFSRHSDNEKYYNTMIGYFDDFKFPTVNSTQQISAVVSSKPAIEPSAASAAAPAPLAASSASAAAPLTAASASAAATSAPVSAASSVSIGRSSTVGMHARTPASVEAANNARRELLAYLTDAPGFKPDL